RVSGVALAELRAERLGTARKQAEIRADGAELATGSEHSLRVPFHRRQVAPRPLRLADPAHRFLDHRHHCGVRSLAGVPERCMQVRRTDEDAVYTFDGADRLEIVQRLPGLDLDQDTDFLVRSLRISGNAAETARTRRAGDSANAR